LTFILILRFNLKQKKEKRNDIYLSNEIIILSIDVMEKESTDKLSFSVVIIYLEKKKVPFVWNTNLNQT